MEVAARVKPSSCVSFLKHTKYPTNVHTIKCTRMKVQPEGHMHTRVTTTQIETRAGPAASGVAPCPPPQRQLHLAYSTTIHWSLLDMLIMDSRSLCMVFRLASCTQYYVSDLRSCGCTY